MDNIIPFYTNDGSVGLYSINDSDIFHSVYGALSEAYDKFVLPANFNYYFKDNNEIKILDLCFGIGYNSKTFLNEIFSQNYFLTENNETIYADNNLNDKCNDKIYTNKISKTKYNISIYSNNILKKSFFKKIINSEKKIDKLKIKIDAIDVNENLMKLSPLLKTCTAFVRPKITGIDKVDKYIYSGKNFKSKYKLKNEVNLLILMSLVDKYGKEYLSETFCELIKSKKWHNFISDDMSHFMRFYISSKGIYLPLSYKTPFLHNIYYKYISKSYKNTLKVLENNEISFNGIIDDARHFLLSNDEIYDFIFLDAFSPKKCPNLWTFDFFKLLYSHLSDNGKILTYSNSPAVRNAFIKNNFYIGKIYNNNENRFTGTIAVKNPNLIQYKLSKYEYGLLDTRAGIMYSDVNLNDSNEKILQRRTNDFNESTLISATKYINNFKGDKNEI